MADCSDFLINVDTSFYQLGNRQYIVFAYVFIVNEFSGDCCVKTVAIDEYVVAI